MGGAAAKERRRLKRLSEQQEKLKADGGTPTGSKDHVSEGKSPGKTVNSVEKNLRHTKNQEQSNNEHWKENSGQKKRQQLQLENTKDSKKVKLNKFQSNSTYKGKKQQYDKKSNKKIPIKAKKVKKPKHLARKLKSETDPEILKKLTKQQSNLDKHKLRRKEKFKLKVIELVGGEKFFDAKIFEKLMEKGGGKIESIVEAVKIDPNAPAAVANEENLTDAEEVLIEGVEDVAKEGGKESSSEEANSEEGKEIKPTMERKDEGKSKNDTRMETASSNDNSSDAIKKLKEAKSSKEKKENKKTDDSESGSSSSDSDSDDEVDLAIETGRTRGRRRRGRQEADAKREEDNAIQKQTKEDNHDNNGQQGNKTLNDSSSPSKDNRRCIGRKPLTDFKVGQKYTGTVVYVKPKLGVFIDINCHADAFCHISRCSDTYIESITDELFKVGDVLTDKVRIVNVDRRKKKLTASLQSDDKIVDEEKSNETWLKRQQEKKEKKMQKQQNKKIASKESSWGGNAYDGADEDDWGHQNRSKQKYSARNIEVETGERKQHDEEAPIVIDPDNMTPAELKRARKLQRRAERRRQKEETGITA